MLRFFNQNTTAEPAQDVEMGIGNVAELSTHITIPPSVLPPIPPQNEEILDPLKTPEILAFMENQKKTIETCMIQVSH